MCDVLCLVFIENECELGVNLFCAQGIVSAPPLVSGGFADIFSELYPHCDPLFTEVAQFICANVICSALACVNS